MMDAFWQGMFWSADHWWLTLPAALLVSEVFTLLKHGRFGVRGVYRKPLWRCWRDLPGDVWSALRQVGPDYWRRAKRLARDPGNPWHV